ncbi:MAG: flagellar hook-basal body complex protein FliE [Firmicutes bacterium]|nr:flagellar hook-basal body complex protein FliE [Bacillota bacterium]
MDPLKLIPGGSRFGPLPPLGGPASSAAAGLAGAAGVAGAADATGQAGAASGQSFAEVLQNTLDQVQQLQATSDRSALLVATGQAQDLHTAMIAAEKATLALDLTAQVRNKVLEAYQEIMRMPV